MGDGQRPLSVGFWFSLGHSSVVFGLSLLLAFGVQGDRRPGDRRRVHAAERHRHDRHDRLGHVPVHHRADQPRRAVRRRPGRARAALGRALRGGDRADARPARADQRADAALRPAHHRAVADVSARAAVRPRVRHRDGDRAAVPGRRRGVRIAAVLRDRLPADPVRRRHVAAGHARRRVHGLRLRLGVRQARAQALLQPHRDGAVGRGRAGDRLARAAVGAGRRGDRPRRRRLRGRGPVRASPGSWRSPCGDSAASSSAGHPPAGSKLLRADERAAGLGGSSPAPRGGAAARPDAA